MRLYPTLLEASTDSRQQIFRAAVDFAETTDPPGPFSRSCITWLLLDTVRLADKPFDKFVFSMDKDANVESVQYDFLRHTFKRAG